MWSIRWRSFTVSESGFCHGRGGSMHVTKVESGLLGANGIVGGGIPLATGSALASKINRGRRGIRGILRRRRHQSGLLPRVHQHGGRLESCPLFISLKTTSTPCRPTSTPPAPPPRWPSALGLRHRRRCGGRHRCAGRHEAMQKAVAYARSGKGPVLLECDVYRYTGHYVGDRAEYMSEAYNAAAHEKRCDQQIQGIPAGGGAPHRRRWMPWRRRWRRVWKKRISLRWVPVARSCRCAEIQLCL